MGRCSIQPGHKQRGGGDQECGLAEAGGGVPGRQPGDEEPEGVRVQEEVGFSIRLILIISTRLLAWLHNIVGNKLMLPPYNSRYIRGGSAQQPS